MQFCFILYNRTRTKLDKKNMASPFTQSELAELLSQIDVFNSVHSSHPVRLRCLAQIRRVLERRFPNLSSERLVDIIRAADLPTTPPLFPTKTMHPPPSPRPRKVPFQVPQAPPIDVVPIPELNLPPSPRRRNFVLSPPPTPRGTDRVHSFCDSPRPDVLERLREYKKDPILMHTFRHWRNMTGRMEKKSTSQQPPIWMHPEERMFFKHEMDQEQQERVMDAFERTKKILNVMPPRLKILSSEMPDRIKALLMKKLELSGPMESKTMTWVDNILRIPFGVQAEMPVTLDSTPDEISTFLKECRSKIDKSTFGHEQVKDAIISLVASRIRQGVCAGNNCLGLCGKPGIGKTSIVKSGLANALNIPMFFYSLGGATSGSCVHGHSITYEGSVQGLVADALCMTGVMNPIIFIDELEKVSGSKHGREVFDALLHLIDPAQNSTFQDKYLGNEIELDVSNSFFVFSYNDAKKIPGVLRDRIKEIQMEDFSNDDKITIAKDYILPEILQNLNIPSGMIMFDDDAIAKIVEFNQENSGMRNIKRQITEIVAALNVVALSGERLLHHLIDLDASLKPPFLVTGDLVDELIMRAKTEEDLTHLSMFC